MGVSVFPRRDCGGICNSYFETSHLSSRATLPLCSRTSQTQATCSWVNPKEVMVELAEGGVGRVVGELGNSPLPPPSPDSEGKLEKLERQLGGPTPGNAETGKRIRHEILRYDM